ncbi:hypothetical protein [Prevotella sp. 10(H)]|uniref:hypothetical protein n=1 Tax=Prevotella sp. 10(H) TaxID=1158294 RepID=UPI0004A747AB|nr:hypothetical protein [Prevotella sp. 10(H)]
MKTITYIMIGIMSFFLQSCNAEPVDAERTNFNLLKAYTIPTNPNLSKVQGNSIQIDPTVLYSLDITPAQLVADLKKANIKSVHYFIVKFWDGSRDTDLLREDYLNALRENNISVWLMLLGNCFYEPTTLPQEWAMEFLTPYPGLHFYSFHNDNFVDWQVERVKRIMQNYDFVGIEFAEAYFPEWKTIETNGFYGDVSEYARRKFTQEYLGRPGSPALDFATIKSDAQLYSKWQDFRVDAVLNFNTKIKNAIKETDRNTLFAAWGMGVRGATLGQIREHFGLDMVRIAQEVDPDILFVQTASQDWSDPYLSYDYLNDYSYIVNSIRQANPDIAIGIQADIASLSSNNPNVAKRTPEWWLNFMDLSLQSGYYTNTSYEYAFSKRQNIWIDSNINYNSPATIYKEASYTSQIIAEAETPLGFVKDGNDGWQYVYTTQGLGWINLTQGTYTITAPVDAYTSPSFYSTMQPHAFAPQTVTVVDRQDEDWIKILTASPYKWIYLKSPNCYYIDHPVKAYKEAVVSSEYYTFDPQLFVIADRKPGNWIEIQTASEFKWIQIDL